ncbi:gamma-butyrobetaine dioxygenase-like [Amphiura filiformis]|uniref:gamma-butyrobetaine dioxygenase-like n=1 Tax=Amphiura filiformis TaxID=82378 RepID=UPI003B225C81
MAALKQLLQMSLGPSHLYAASFGVSKIRFLRNLQTEAAGPIQQISKFHRFLYQATTHVRRIHTDTIRRAAVNYSSMVPLDSLQLKNDDKILEVTWRDGDTQIYPYPWLRDNCMCESCYNYSTHTRSFSIHDIDVEVIPNEAILSLGKTTLTIIWPDGHKSEYSSDWLKENRFNHSEDDLVLYPKYRYWGNDLEQTLCAFDFADVLEDDKVLFKMLLEIKTLGLCRISGAGTQEEQVKKVADRIAFLHTTYFG